MRQHVSKSSFKAKALKYFRPIERTGKELIGTDRGKPVLGKPLSWSRNGGWS